MYRDYDHGPDRGRVALEGYLLIDAEVATADASRALHFKIQEHARGGIARMHMTWEDHISSSDPNVEMVLLG